MLFGELMREKVAGNEFSTYFCAVKYLKLGMRVREMKH